MLFHFNFGKQNINVIFFIHKVFAWLPSVTGLSSAIAK